MTEKIIREQSLDEYFITTSPRLGRLLRSLKPFHLGEGRYQHSSDPSDWRLEGDLSLTVDEKQHFIDRIGALRLNSLRNVVAGHRADGYVLIEHPDHVFEVMKKSKK